jgi:hypothetical protein
VTCHNDEAFEGLLHNQTLIDKSFVHVQEKHKAAVLELEQLTQRVAALEQEKRRLQKALESVTRSVKVSLKSPRSSPLVRLAGSKQGPVKWALCLTNLNELGSTVAALDIMNLERA